MRERLLGSLILWASCCLLFAPRALAQGEEKPNIVLILVDDSGLMDFGAFGGEAKTPNIDQLAREGTMLTNFHTSPVCAPSRAMLITGVDSHLAGVANLPEMLPAGYAEKPGYAGVLNDKVQTVATRLKEVGYNTYVTGKWHLGHDEKTLPSARGFDRTFILAGSGGNNYTTQGYLPQKPKAKWFADGQKVETLPEDFYSSKDLIHRVIDFHDAERDKDSPFFAYIAFLAVHAPLQAPEEYVKPYLEVYKDGWDVIRQKRFEKAREMGIIPEDAALNDMFPDFKKWEELTTEEKERYITDAAVLAGMLEAMDAYIGEYVTYLKQEGLYDNTIFIIASDNGPDGGDYDVATAKAWRKVAGYHKDRRRLSDKKYYGSIGPQFAQALASPFSFFKYYTGEGGVRTPLIVSGKDIPIGQRSNEFCFITDIVPTVLELAGMEPKSNESHTPLTGKSLLRHLRDLSIPVYGPDEGVGMEAANNASYYQGDFKIVKNNIPLGDRKWRLYNLKIDPAETTDLSEENPEKLAAMVASYDEYARRVGVLEMEEGYTAQGEVLKQATVKILKDLSVYLILLFLALIGLGRYIWKRRSANR